jgi:DNA-binding IscR family transcriptional regulator
MDTETVFKIINHINRQIDMINGYALNNKGGLTEAEAIGAIASRKTLKQLSEYLQEYIELQVAQVEGT